MKNFLVLLFFGWSYIFAQVTAIPDSNFEQALIYQNIDSDGVVNGHILTSDVNNLQILNVAYRNIQNFQGIEAFTNLESLNIDNNASYLFPLPTQLNLSQNFNLKYLSCSGNTLESLDLSNNVLLEQLGCNRNYFLIDLDLSNNPNLTILHAYQTSLTNVYVYNMPNLEDLRLYSSNLSFLNVSNNTNLKQLVLHNNNLTQIDVTNNVLLEGLGLINNPLISIDLSQNPLLSGLGIENTNLTTLNLNNNPLLDIINCRNNSQMETVYLQNNANNLLNGTFEFNGDLLNKFMSVGSANLSCIFVDDITNCNTNWLGKDPSASYVSTQSDCNAIVLDDKGFVTEEQITFAPNPTNDFVTINFKGKTPKIIITLENILGQVVTKKVFTNTSSIQYDITGNSGIYFLSIENENGIKTTQKIIKN